MSESIRARLTSALFLCVLSGLLLLTISSRAQDNTDFQYFPETRQLLEGKFLRFFTENGGLAVLGYPISQAFPYGELTVQYFQNGRLEEASDGQVYLSLLPYEYSLKRTAPISEEEVPAGGVFYPATGHSVSMAFLDFYLQHGGPSIFGYPITELVNENDRMVQYFERGIFEWWPELPEKQKVQLNRLGAAYFQIAKHSPAYMDPPFARIRLDDYSITRLHVSATVHSPILGRDEESQTIYVQVSDQVGQAIEGATVEAFILRDQVEQIIEISPDQTTDADGTALFFFSTADLSAAAQLGVGETIPVQIRVSYQDYEVDTATAFRIWW